MMVPLFIEGDLFLEPNPFIKSQYQLVTHPEDAKFILKKNKENHWAVVQKGKSISMEIDFKSSELAHRLQYGMAKNQLFFKALGKLADNKKVFDLTAGLGVDSFFMAHSGADVLSVERDPLMHFLLNEALGEYLQGSEFENAGKMNLYCADGFLSFTDLVHQFGIPAAVYIDPMFPTKKKAALPSKEMQILSELLCPNTDDELSHFLAEAKKLKLGVRYIVKRPLKAPEIYQKPTNKMAGKSIRYDIYRF